MNTGRTGARKNSARLLQNNYMTGVEATNEVGGRHEDDQRVENRQFENRNPA